jgi:hypothetical protein
LEPPAYYTRGRIEVWDFIRDQQLNYHLGCAIKYICRAGFKGSAISDLKKAIHYLDNELQHVTESSEGIPDSVWDHLVAGTDRDAEIFDR